MRIMMVCLGNICRSPLAEGIMLSLIKKHQLDWTVDSSGTSGFHNGQHPDRRSIEVAQKNGIDISRQRSAEFSMYDFDEYDIILAMDQSNKENILSLARTDEDRQKVKLILNYNLSHHDQNVPDPYYEGGFDSVYEMIREACEGFIMQHS